MYIHIVLALLWHNVIALEVQGNIASVNYLKSCILLSLKDAYGKVARPILHLD